MMILADQDPAAAMQRIKSDLQWGDVDLRQESLRVLGTIDTPEAYQVLLDLVGQVQSGALPVALHVDVLELARLRKGDAMELLLILSKGDSDDGTAWYESAWTGGDAERGRALVLYHPGAACIRCHAIDGHGGIAGPDLSMVGDRLDRAALLESIIRPGAVITEGYGEVTAMPEMTEHLDPRDVRDIVEYLSTRR